MAIKYDNCKGCHSRCVHAGKDREFICINGVSCKITKEKPNTNAQKIRSMSDEELSVFLCEEFDCGSESCPGIKLCKPNEGKANGLLKWLQQPAEPPKEDSK